MFNNVYYNRDIMDWDKFPVCDMIWTDPPWGDKMVKYFETVMKRDAGKVASNTLHAIINKLATLAPKNIPVLIEYSINNSFAEIITPMVQAGHTFISSTSSTYSDKKHPYVLLLFNRFMTVSPAHGARAITETLRDQIFIQTVFDPFAGIGVTAKAVNAAGKLYIGSEINPARFEKLIRI